MQKNGVQNPVINWVHSFLSHKSIFVKTIYSKRSTLSTLAGVLHCITTLTVYVSGISILSAQISQFADDFAFYYGSSSCRIKRGKLQYSIDTLIKSCENQKI